MNPVVQAAPNTALISLDPDATPAPIIGWMVLPNGRARPIIPGRSGSILTGEGFFVDSDRDGPMVVDACTGECFCTVSDWRRTVEDREPYSVGRVIPELDFGSGGVPVVAVAPSGKRTPVAPGAAVIRFNGKVYEKGTFWKLALDGENFIAIMSVQGKVASPIGPGVVRVTRNDFNELRQTLTVVEARDDIMDQLRAIGSAVEPGPSPQVEEPEDEDEDDAADLI